MTAKERLGALLTFPNAIVVLLIFVIFFGAVGEIGEPDLWWHLRNAEHLATTHSFPNVDTYSFTAAGSPWLDHEWLSELIYYGAFRTGGLRGIFAIYFVLAFVIFFLVYRLACDMGANPKTAAVLSIISILLARVSFGPRMLLFGWLWLVLVMLILQHDRAHPRLLWLLPPLFCLWINLHGSWVFGFVIVGAYILSGLFSLEWGVIYSERFAPGELKRLIAIAAASVAALFINPFGYKLVFYPFDLALRQQTNINNIDEWASVDFHDPRGKVVMLLLLGVLATALISRLRWRLYDVLLAIFALYWGLTYSRMQFFAALIFVPLLAQRVKLFPAYDPAKEKPWLNAAIILTVFIFIGVRFPSEASLQREVEKLYPASALEYMQEHHLTDRVLNDYIFGGYMIWHTRDIKTFVDGRADLFVYNGVFDDYVKFARIVAPYEVLDKYRIRYVLIQPHSPRAYLLRHSACWHFIFEDQRAILFERDESQDACRIR